MELNSEERIGKELMSQVEFSKIKRDVTISAIDYAMSNDMVDWTRIGNVRYVVMTEKSKKYTPKKKPTRTQMIMRT